MNELIDSIIEEMRISDPSISITTNYSNDGDLFIIFERKRADQIWQLGRVISARELITLPELLIRDKLMSFFEEFNNS